MYAIDLVSMATHSFEGLSQANGSMGSSAKRVQGSASLFPPPIAFKSQAVKRLS